MSSLLKIVVCLAGPYKDVIKLANMAKNNGWDVQVLLTLNAAKAFKHEKLIGPLERVTGNPVLYEWQLDPRDRKESSLSPMLARHAAIVALASLNTISKLAMGMCDNYATTAVQGLVGEKNNGKAGVAVALCPFVNANLAAHPMFQPNIAALKRQLVHVVDRVPHDSGADTDCTKLWADALEAIEW
jgi:phosphopantothenoylcysteine synthetase/decarboxylase